MARRIDPVDVIAAFFENAPLEQAALMLTIVKGIVARRQPKAATVRSKRIGSIRPSPSREVVEGELPDDNATRAR